jgi:hypothetical protein
MPTPAYLNVDIINPSGTTDVIVNGIQLKSLAGGPGTVNKYIGTSAPASLTANANLMVGSGGSGISTGNRNTVLGLFSGGSITTGDDNVAIGTGVLSVTNFGSDNIAIGRNSLALVTNPFGEVAIGHLANQFFTTATVGPNTAVGHRALWQNLTGGENTALGVEAGAYITTGSGNTFLGSYTGALATTGTNNICIGHGSTTPAPTTSNSITLGNISNNVLRCAVTSITSLSDSRDKEDVKDLSTGLDFVKSLRPVEFTWNDRDEAGKHGVADFGFIAQDLKKAQEDAEKAEVLKLVYDENPEKLEASYGKLIPILVKAIQELSAEVTSLKKK